jgi:ribose 5-phosphate isomerase
MKKTVVLIMVSSRKEAASKVQQILTGWGCMIKTRLGIHEGVLDDCTENGLIILEVVGEEEKKAEMERKLNVIPGVVARRVDLELA